MCILIHEHSLPFAFSFQFKKLRDKYSKTGAEAIPDHEKLNELEEMALHFTGEEAVLGENSTLNLLINM